MKELNKLIDEASELLSFVEDTRSTVQDHLRDFESSATDIDGAIAELSLQASRLTALIDEARRATPHLHDPVTAATIQAIDNLLMLLTEARKHFTDGDKTAGYGTLTAFDHHADDLRAAFRLCQMQNRRAA